jgi:hypothetical protein
MLSADALFFEDALWHTQIRLAMAVLDESEPARDKNQAQP